MCHWLFQCKLMQEPTQDNARRASGTPREMTASESAHSGSLQFGLGGLFLATTLACIGVTSLRLFGAIAFGWWTAVTFLASFRLFASSSHWGLAYTSLALIQAALFASFGLSLSNYYTVGFVASVIYAFAAVLCIIPAATLALGYVRMGLLASVLVGLIVAGIAPGELSRYAKLKDLQAEADQLLHRAQEHHTISGEYPSSLDFYLFANPSLEANFRYDGSANRLELFYFVEDASTGYYFDSEYGFWYYEDD